MGEVQHGSHTGIAWHTQRHEPFCLPCAAFSSDKARGYLIGTGKSKLIRVSVLAIARILRGADPDAVLTEELGPQTMTALRRLRAGDQRG